MFEIDVFIVNPLEHGNGGCYGSELLAIMPLNAALMVNPMEEYDIFDYGITYFPRICSTDNMNDVMYTWCDVDKKWEDEKRYN
jgi:hypothetical protein